MYLKAMITIPEEHMSAPRLKRAMMVALDVLVVVGLGALVYVHVRSTAVKVVLEIIVLFLPPFYHSFWRQFRNGRGT
jgi:hypothetical protein